MKSELFPFQKTAVLELRQKVNAAANVYGLTATPQVVSFTAPTGSGKTIVMSALIEDILFGNEQFVEQPDAIFVWLSDSPALNEQSKQKIDLKADKIRLDQCVTITDESFDMEMLEDGHIYFLNTQKLGKLGNLGKHSDTRQFTIWETLQNTAKNKYDRLFFVIDEAHRGMQGKDAGKATSIMQKFLKGSRADGLDAMPVVIGMSATSERFNRLVEGTSSTIHKVIVSPQDVRASGLLKDRIIITYPSESTESNEMAVLKAASEEWKDKCLHWYQYTYEQHYANVNPVFVVQVQNGNNTVVSKTNLDDCIATIEKSTGWTFSEGEVVQTFSQTAVTAHGLSIPYIEPTDIAENRGVRVVFFKENLSTGWDCPRAETMMSFRHADDSTYIAQLLGRMIRTPLQSHIIVDESLNDVHLYLPYFNEETVKAVINELQNSEGGEIPTVIENESLGEQVYTTWTTGRKRTQVQPVSPDQLTMADVLMPGFADNYLAATSPENEASVVAENLDMAMSLKEIHPQQEPVQPDMSVKLPVQKMPEQTFAPVNEGEQQSIADYGIDRDGIVKYINELGLLTYTVKSVQITRSYLDSMISLAQILAHSGLDKSALTSIKEDIISIIRGYADYLHTRGQYKELAAKLLQIKLDTQVFDVWGDEITGYDLPGFFATDDSDIDRRLRLADAKLGRAGIQNEYGRRYYDAENPNGFKIDVILFAESNECLSELAKYAEEKFHELNDANRKYIRTLSENFQTQYIRIVSNGDIVSKHSFILPEEISVKSDKNGQKYSDHLFIDDAAGYARIALNEWEQAVLEEERKRNDFVTWYRNPSRASGALTIPYIMDNETKPMYPDFIIIRKDNRLGYILDILEPHGSHFKDNINKAKGLAEYAAQVPDVGRIQLIRMSKDVLNRNRLKRLDMSKGHIREKVIAAVTNDELDHIFDTDGFFEEL